MKLVKHLLLLVLRLNLNFIRLNDFGSAVHAAGPFLWKISLYSVDENYFTNLLISYILSIQQLKGKQFTASIFFS